MADIMSSWLAKAIIVHDVRHGANLNRVIEGPGRLVQIKRFYTFRTPDAPTRQITGLVSDKTHDVLVDFDVEATNRFENPDIKELEQESLTSQLRSIMVIKSFRWKIIAPPHRRRSADGRLELPTVIMEVLEFDIHNGDSNNPIFYEDTCEIGRAKDDGPVQRVLRKWYCGESNSEPSQPERSFEISQPEAGPSSRIISSPRTNRVLPDGVISLSTFLEPFLAEGGAKRGRTIPEWIFKTSHETRAELDEVQMFGLDFDTGHTGPSTSTISPVAVASRSSPEKSSDATRLDKGKQREVPHTQVPTSRPDATTPQTQYTTPPVPLGQRPRSTQTITQPTLESPGADDEDSDGEIPIRPAYGGAATQRRPMFDPLKFSSQSSEPEADKLSMTSSQFSASKAKEAGVQDEEEEEIEFVDDVSTDSEMLSDHERSVRRRSKRKREDGEEVKTEIKDVPMTIEDESIPASESVESYSLSKRFPSPIKGARDSKIRDRKPSSSPPGPRKQQRLPVALPIVVGHAQVSQAQDQDSLGSNKTTSGATQSLPTPPPSDNLPDGGDAANSSPPRAKQPISGQRSIHSPLEPPKPHAITSVMADKRQFDATDIKPTVGVGSGGSLRDLLAIDMSVEGLKEATVLEYTRKVTERRAAAALRRRTSETPRNPDR